MAKKQETTGAKILKRIYAKGRGSLIFTNDFKTVATQGAAKLVLSRLTLSQVLFRLAPGIYLFPKMDPQMGVLIPSLESISAAIAKRDKARILPTGILALNQLGLSTQVPLRVVYLTDGSPRRVVLGKQSILFKKTSPKMLGMKGKISRLVVMALQEIGKENATEKQLEQLKSILKKEDQKLALHDIQLAPAWIRSILTPTLNPKKNAIPKTTTRKKG